MSLRRILGKLLIYGILEMGALAGVPMSPEQIEKIMQVMNRIKVVHVIKTDDPK
jgi:hypothetical protein